MSGKRGPSVLVTDARERPPTRGGGGTGLPSSHRSSNSNSGSSGSSSGSGGGSSSSASAHQRNNMRHISVDNVLQNASEIPSGQPRVPPGPQRLLPTASLSAARRRGLARNGAGGASGSGVSSGAAAGGPAGTGPAGPGAGGVGGVGMGSGGGGASGALPGGAGVGLPLQASSRTGLPNVPSRTTKISEKLVLLPDPGDGEDEEDDDDADDDDLDGEVVIVADLDEATVGAASTTTAAAAADTAMEHAALLAPPVLSRARADQQQQQQPHQRKHQPHHHQIDGAIFGNGGDDDERPPRDEELDVLRKRGGIRGKSYAERLPKGQRTEKVARLTAYCTAQAFKMRATADFLRTHHAAKTKLYDDCLYVVYHLPLLPGHDGFRIRSRPMLKTPGTGKTVLDLEIERSERRDEHMGYFDGDGDKRAEPASTAAAAPSPPSTAATTTSLPPAAATAKATTVTGRGGRGRGAGRPEPNVDDLLGSSPPVNRLAPDAKHFAELFVFSYGVVVFWNFTEHQEKDILADLAFAEAVNGSGSGGSGGALASRPLDEAEFETEEFHFEYSARVKRPRVFNDMITLLPRSDHMVKLTISHAIAQSTKLCFFEEKMSQTMQNAQDVPKQLALTGELNMSRTEIVKMLGRLFKNRVDINLSSNILDVPNFFWDAEPTLHPLYAAIREYLEIDPRIQVLNERCRVFLDLAEILADSVADAKMSYITYIVIILIVVSILVTVTEVVLRFSILERGKEQLNNSNGNKSGTAVVGLLGGLVALRQPVLAKLRPNQAVRKAIAAAAAGGDAATMAADTAEAPLGGEPAYTLEELRAWAAQLRAQERAAVCGGDVIGRTFAGV